MSAAAVNGPASSLADIRQSALERAKELGVPHSKQENWLYTDVSKLEQPFSAFAQAKPSAEESAWLKQLILPGQEQACLVFFNGVLQQDLSDLQGVKGLHLEHFEELSADSQSKNLEEKQSFASSSDEYFQLLNLAHFSSEVFLQWKSKDPVQKPVQVIFATANSGQTPRGAFARLNWTIGTSTEATVLLTQASKGPGGVLNSPWQSIHLEKNSKLRVEEVQVQQEGLLLPHLEVAAQRDAHLEVLSAYEGTPLYRQSVTLSLNEENASADIRGLGLVGGESEAHQFLRVRHMAPQCQSRQVFKHVLFDEARTSFDGLVFVAHGAQGTDAHQLNQNLMLSPSARADANPRLDIFADDVKCAHGATVGRLNEEEVFYLRTRGLPETEAKKLLTIGFATEIVEGFSCAALRNLAMKEVLGKLGASTKGSTP